MLENGVYADEIKKWEIDSVTSSVRLHDVGKINVPEDILNKPGKLTEKEFEIVKNHAADGEKIINDTISHTGEVGFLSDAKVIAAYHHERWDGTGYPRGLKGNEIPLQGRIMAIADVYDALVSERPYKEAFPHERAVEIILESKGTQFDPQIVDIFLEVQNLFKEIHI
jgi:putative two-component system response regulator